MAKVGDAATTFLGGGNGDDLLIAEPQQWTVQLASLNGSGVTGTATIGVSEAGLRVQVEASGLEAGQPHAMHIHGLSTAGGVPVDSQPGTLAQDADGDGFVELAEGRVTGGPPILTLGTATGAGTISYDHTFSLDGGEGLAPGQDMADLFPLTSRLLEIHGMSVPAGEGQGTGGEVDGTAGYKAVLPVAAGEITQGATAAATATGAGGEDGVMLAGGNGQDHLIGGHGADLLIGGNGRDVLAGGGGDDDLVGGRGADRFVVGDGKDAISDFHPDQGDRLDFGGVAASDLVARQTNQGLWITVGDGPLSDPGTEGVLLVSVHATSGTQISDWLA